MKNTIFAVVVTVFTMIGSAQAITPAVGGALHFIATHGLAAYAITHPVNIMTCESQPNVTAAHKGNESGYSFEVTSCDFQANKDRLVRQ